MGNSNQFTILAVEISTLKLINYVKKKLESGDPEYIGSLFLVVYTA